MGFKRKMTDEQRELFEKSGAKNDWVVGLVFIIIFLVIVGINIFCRYNDNRKLKKMEYTEGVVTSRQDYEKWYGRRRHISDSIIVEYTPEGSDKKYSFRDSDGPYEFIYKGDVIGVYYDKRNPEKVFIAKTDWLTGKDVRADKNYEALLIVAVFPLIIAAFFFVEELIVRKKIKKGIGTTDDNHCRYCKNSNTEIKINPHKPKESWTKGELKDILSIALFIPVLVFLNFLYIVSIF